MPVGSETRGTGREVACQRWPRLYRPGRRRCLFGVLARRHSIEFWDVARLGGQSLPHAPCPGRLRLIPYPPGLARLRRPRPSSSTSSASSSTPPPPPPPPQHPLGRRPPRSPRHPQPVRGPPCPNATFRPHALSAADGERLVRMPVLPLPPPRGRHQDSFLLRRAARASGSPNLRHARLRHFPAVVSAQNIARRARPSPSRPVTPGLIIRVL